MSAEPTTPAAPDVPTAQARHPRLGHPFAGLATALAAALTAFGWAWLWLRAELADWVERLGVPMDVPTDVAVDFGTLAGALALLAWLVGARTRLRPGTAVTVVAAAVLCWTAAGYALFAAGQFPAWPAFEAPFVLADQLDYEVGPTWSAFAGPLAALLLTGLAAWLGARGRDTDARPEAPGTPWGSALLAVGVVLGCGTYVGLQILVWPTDVIGAWPATELLGWPFVALALAAAVAWATSGRGRGTAALNVAAALALLTYATGTTVESPFMVVIGAATVAVAAAHRPFARTLHGLLA